MVDFSKNKWKCSTIGLMVILAVGFSFPQAFAAPIDNVLGMVRDMQAKVNSSAFGLDAIKTAVDTKASQESVDTLQETADDIQNTLAAQGSGGMKGVNFRINLEEFTDQWYTLIPEDSEKVYSGEIYVAFCCSAPDDIIIECYAGGRHETIYSSFFDPDFLGQSTGNRHVNLDFVCNQLQLRLIHDGSHFLDLGASVVYQEVTAEFIDLR